MSNGHRSISLSRASNTHALKYRFRAPLNVTRAAPPYLLPPEKRVRILRRIIGLYHGTVSLSLKRVYSVVPRTQDIMRNVLSICMPPSLARPRIHQ